MPPRRGRGSERGSGSERGRGSERGSGSERGRASAHVAASVSPHALPPVTPGPSSTSPAIGFPVAEEGTPSFLPHTGASATADKSTEGSKAPTSRSPTHSPTRSPSPYRVRGGSIVQSQNWLSVKNPDMLSVSERVVHHNQAIIATELSELKAAFTHYASSRAKGGQEAKEDEDPEAAARDASILELLNDEEFLGVLRDQMGVLKSERGTLTNTRGTKGKPALDQAKAFLKQLSIAAAQHEQEVQDDMVTGEEQQPAPILTRIFGHASSLSEKALMEWVISLVKQFDLGPKKAAKKASKAATEAEFAAEGEGEGGRPAGGRKRKNTGTAEQDPSPSKKSKPTRSRHTVPDDDEEEDEENEMVVE